MIDLHTHTIFSDGELIPSELVRRAESIGYRALAITDHVDYSNYRFVLERLYETVDILNENTSLTVIPGVEITHVPPVKIPELIQKCRETGAKLVVVHGETVVEPVASGTNRAAIEGKADILAHPGLITKEEVELAVENGIYLEITSRKGHNITNGHVAKLAKEIGAKLVINTDTHSPGDLIPRSFAIKVGIGAGLTIQEVEECFINSEKIVENCKKQLLKSY
ncbi:PHP domain protein [Desulfurobacterium thermolithotrophum DSM 11699]|uniref:PHP domain protein n=1 Tax=Desulfurobacterium thermolithotrophum (strain DSM 11699 / BSA) TaxID=868864 RepID=F0S3R6_DESTD|nr:histidinol phosphate phosphatase domain-containing protein [Desulfurobacterium thermolithotrophum]ADY73488.1 PHP domain protein [Desulfurobacterium thermolithotrophum DSM 11699]